MQLSPWKKERGKKTSGSSIMEVDIGGGVEVPAYHVAGLGHVEFLEQL